MSMRKAVIFARVSDMEMEMSNNEVIDIELVKLRKYAKVNNFNVLKEFSSIEDFWQIEEKGLTGSPKFLEITNFIKSQQEKFFVICYAEFDRRGSDPEIEKQFKELLLQQKIEIKNYRHPCFKEPVNHAKIWRYISLPKFIDLLQSHTMFFTRGDVMRVLDKAEGTVFTKRSLEIHEILKQMKSDEVVVKHPNFSRTAGDLLESDRVINDFNEAIAIKQKFINCWHMNEDESFAMWKIYSDDFGVRIESTYQNLCDGFEDEKWGFYNEDGKNKIYIGEVDYIDRAKQTIPQDYGFRPYLNKGRQFSYEQELRCIIYDSKGQALNQRAKVNLDKLINKICINPFAPSWFESSVKNLCEKYGFNPNKVQQSNLN